MPNRGERMPGVYYFPSAKDITRPEMVLFPCILRGTLSQSPSVFNNYSLQEWLEAKRQVIKNCGTEKHFVYAHAAMPEHAPWDPRDRKSDNEEQLAYAERLKMANKQIEDDLKIIENDPEALVIMMSDHGGSLLCPDIYGKFDIKNIIDHFGVLLAIRWPKDYSPKLSLTCLQNVLLEVMIYMSGEDSLAHYANEGETVALPSPINCPKGIIKKGVMHIEEYENRSFSASAAEAFGQ